LARDPRRPCDALWAERRPIQSGKVAEHRGRLTVVAFVRVTIVSGQENPRARMLRARA